jgi:hypothetical protein
MPIQHAPDLLPTCGGRQSGHRDWFRPPRLPWCESRDAADPAFDPTVGQVAMPVLMFRLLSAIGESFQPGRHPR